MLRAVRTARTPSLPTTAAAIGIAPSAREPRRALGWSNAKPKLLPVPYFHIVFTLPSAIGDIAYQNKPVIYELLFKASAAAMLTIAADKKHLGAAHVGLGDDPSSPRAHDRARRRSLGRWQALDYRQTEILSSGKGALET